MTSSAFTPSSASSAAIGPPSAVACTLQAGIHLGIDGAEDCDGQARADGDTAVGAHQDDRLLPERFDQRRPLGRIADQHVGRAEFFAYVEHGHAAGEEGGIMEHRPHRLSDEAERNYRRRMRVHHARHVGPCLVNRAVDEAFEKDAAPARLARLRVEIEFHDVSGSHEALASERDIRKRSGACGWRMLTWPKASTTPWSARMRLAAAKSSRRPASIGPRETGGAARGEDAASAGAWAALAHNEPPGVPRQPHGISRMSPPEMSGLPGSGSGAAESLSVFSCLVKLERSGNRLGRIDAQGGDNRGRKYPTQGCEPAAGGADSKGKTAMSRRTYEVGSGNVFADIGVPNADEHLVKASFVYKIDRLINERGLKQVEAAELFGVKQPDVSKMLNGDFRQFSRQRLLRFLVALGQDVEIVVKPPRDPQRPAALHVI